MTTQHPISRFSILLLGGLLVTAVACTNEVETHFGDAVGGMGGQPGTGGVGGVPGSGGAGTGGLPNTGGAGGMPQQLSDGIAIRQGDIEPTMGTTSSGNSTVSTTAQGGPTQDPDTLLLVVGDTAQQCADPYGGLDCGNHWKVYLQLPVSMQQPGVYSLAQLNGFMSISADGPGPDCGGGGGSFIDGTAEVVSIDGNHVDIVLANTISFDFNADGPHSLSRCPAN